MKYFIHATLGTALSFTLTACFQSAPKPDATGIFEAREVLISAEAAGVIRQLNIEEGQLIEAGKTVGMIDCEQIALQKAQADSRRQALQLKKNEAEPQAQVLAEQAVAQEKQADILREQLRVAQIELRRLQNLVKSQAAPPKHVDDAQGQIAVLERQLNAAEAQVNVTKRQMQALRQNTDIANRAILSEDGPILAQVAQIEDQLRRCEIVNPIDGTVLIKYAEPFEMAAPGKALYKIADIRTLTLRAYISGDQLPLVKLGQEAEIKVAYGEAESRSYRGRVAWIADKAEFTPKTIQTKNERANLVYAVKIEAANDSLLKIGMYGEVFFKTNQ